MLRCTEGLSVRSIHDRIPRTATGMLADMKLLFHLGSYKAWPASGSEVLSPVGGVQR